MSGEPGRIFGKNVNLLRTRAALTQEDLAEKADISRRYLQEIESGSKIPTIRVLSKLRKALKCDWNEILKGL